MAYSSQQMWGFGSLQCSLEPESRLYPWLRCCGSGVHFARNLAVNEFGVVYEKSEA